NNMDWLDAIWIGISQILALFPGMSRSGATITGGMTRNLDRPSAARFSFLMSIPVMLAAGLIASMDLIAMPDFAARLPVYIPGFIAAAVTGYLAIRWLLRFLTHYPLYIFSIYCVFLALLTITVYFVR
ncbi:MAG: undecaprenyl-diphosphate phosphatase, partial [Anaerolineales bacterium]|nr:undecaprenyl-diphosphate phosphatase [Anaerolineales bacterium]